MRNLKSLVTRLGAMSLAATLLFSVSLNAANARASKEDAAKAAILHALVSGVKGAAVADDSRAVATTTTSFTDNVAIGTAATNADLTVYGDGVFDGSLTVGAISADSKVTPGTKLITGVLPLNPKTQQLKVSFKTKGTQPIGNGAWFEADFMTTATRKGVADIYKAAVGVSTPKLYFHPQLTTPNIIRSAGVNTGKDLKATSTWVIANGPALSVADFRLTPTIRHEAITNDIAIGFVPYSVTTTNGTSGYYDSGYVANNSTNYYTYDAGLVSYRIISDNVANVAVVTSVTDSVAVADVFNIFTADELQELLDALNTYFGDSTKALEYMTSHRQELGAAVRALRS